MQIENLKFLMKSSLYTLRRSQMKRTKENVLREYDSGWRQYESWLEQADTVDQWLSIPNVDDPVRFANIEGRLVYGEFNAAQYNRHVLISALRKYFPKARSFTEFGCGVGRNLLFLKQEMPEAEIFGYELCAPGVDISRSAAAKFGFDVQYAQLDFLNDPSGKYIFPKTDVAFTMFALEQIPSGARQAISNILSNSRFGTIHMEPVPENYPRTYRGILGRLDHRRADYLSGFDRAVRGLPLAEIKVEAIESSHNPLMFPSLYVLRK